MEGSWYWASISKDVHVYQVQFVKPKTQCIEKKWEGGTDMRL